VIQSFLPEGLIEDLNPDEIPSCWALVCRSSVQYSDKLIHLTTKAYDSGFVQSHYAAKREG
jgi:hypothetical protein